MPDLATICPSNVEADILFAKDVGWDRKSPCNDCPFLKTSPFHEGVAGSLPLYMQSIQDGEFAHTCHKTDNRPGCDGPRNWHGEQPQHCVGAILMLMKTGKGMDLQLPLLRAAEAGKIDLREMMDRAKKAANVFTVFELLKFYGRKLGEKLQTPAMKAALRRRERRKSRN